MNGRPREATWQTIINVVKTAPIENIEIVNNVVQYLMRPDVQSEYISTNQQGESHRILNINLI